MQWITPPTSAEFREGMESLLSAMEYFKTGKLVSDTTNMGALLPDDQTWAATIWFERAVKAGYSKLANIVPPEVFTQISVEDTFSQVANPFPVTNFDNLQEAIEWMEKA